MIGLDYLSGGGRWRERGVFFFFLEFLGFQILQSGRQNVFRMTFGLSESHLKFILTSKLQYKSINPEVKINFK